MILYKYVDSETADLIIKNSTLKFSRASSLNDPFELTGLHYGSEEQYKEQTLKFLSASISYGILSLTRAPLNPLMWAHYGKGANYDDKKSILLDKDNGSHAGVVFGIDANEAELNDEGLNVIPAKYGSVIYASTKPHNPYINSDNLNFFEGMQFHYNPDFLEALQRTFLYKPAYWSYEEEVRVVRNISRYRNEIQPISSSSIKEIYIGLRNAYKHDYLKTMRDRITQHLPECKIYVCFFDIYEWAFIKISIDEAIEQITLYNSQPNNPA
ncbi:DUF2971 domain-containing protein [Escherichia coli]|jgi:hypothetical protein|uniref:DUF2971 domain-containing protein n=1 Tax=Enterobacter intestinihominis TaxID=3133180 RepID=A0ABV1ZGT3_9ENTR|nr:MULTISPECIES: DUF2971 domain-containing protein [Enterobacter cloacae complex]EUM27472.1 hypothetical protein L462_02650 [Enterobacter sp. BIDMC 26]KJO61866.1 hypothetical protein SR88_04350 [Enterobacter hormaechei subsp. steigerwaltii]MCQ4355019.1 DUF2971 domain-containing protein [Enterobacter kobei]MEB6374239.1 DUF2971 domain-containing protein [Enterobacter kobei]HDC4313028.1 DUF2971 domain-containing protein [Enterobacter kobei]